MKTKQTKLSLSAQWAKRIILRTKKGESYSVWKYGAVFGFIASVILFGYMQSIPRSTNHIMALPLMILVVSITNYRLAGFLELIEKEYTKKNINQSSEPAISNLDD